MSDEVDSVLVVVKFKVMAVESELGLVVERRSVTTTEGESETVPVVELRPFVDLEVELTVISPDVVMSLTEADSALVDEIGKTLALLEVAVENQVSLVEIGLFADGSSPRVVRMVEVLLDPSVGVPDEIVNESAVVVKEVKVSSIISVGSVLDGVDKSDKVVKGDSSLLSGIE